MKYEFSTDPYTQVSALGLGDEKYKLVEMKWDGGK